MKPLTKNVIEKIIKDQKADVSYIILASKYDCSLRTISNIRKKYVENVAKNKAERKLKFSDTFKQDIIRSIRAEVDNVIQFKNKFKAFNNI